MCRKKGTQARGLTIDHKPNLSTERQRIIAAGGQVYQTTTQIAGKKGFVGPYRVRPGGLSVSRAIGDPMAKLPSHSGNPKVIIAEPDIISFKITNEHDFIVIGSDGIFDQLSNEDVVQCVWNTTIKEKAFNIHQQCGVAIDCIMKNALARRSLDNITAAIIAFKNFKASVFPVESGSYLGKSYDLFKGGQNIEYKKEYPEIEYKQRLGTKNLNTMHPQLKREVYRDSNFGLEFKELHKALKDKRYNL